jgi:CBS domain-containing protein
MTTVGDRMLTRPTTHPADATVGEARAFFGDSHKHLMLLVRDGLLCGTLVRSDIPDGVPDDRAALDVAVLAGRTVAADADVDAVRSTLVTHEMRRIAVVDDAGRLLGLLCLKKHQRGFCSDDDVDDRVAERGATGYVAGRDEA